MHLNLKGACKVMAIVRASNALECFAQSVLIGAALIYGPSPAFAQTQQEQSPDHAAAPPTQEQEATAKPQTPQTTPAPVPNPVDQTADNSKGKQTKRMLWIIPNFTAVKAHTKLPPPIFRGEIGVEPKGHGRVCSINLAG